jgi:hypothetical protein
MDIIHTVDAASWEGPFSEAERRSAITALESGMVVHFPALPFALSEEERALLSPALSDGRAKNISLDPSGKLKHTTAAGEAYTRLAAMMKRFARSTESLVGALFPDYRGRLERARTSFRPAEIEGRSTSPLHDDTRLHVDAFPTTPMHGRRILRVFSNIHPEGRARLWNVGEPFAAVARRFLPRLREPVPAKAWLLAVFGVTHGVRTPYDDIMLGLHDAAKLDMGYQERCLKSRIAFAPGTTWLCYTDQVMHAVLSGQHALEQTFHLGVEAMAAPDKAPIRVLEAMMRRTLA